MNGSGGCSQDSVVKVASEDGGICCGGDECVVAIEAEESSVGAGSEQGIVTEADDECWFCVGDLDIGEDRGGRGGRGGRGVEAGDGGVYFKDVSGGRTEGPLRGSPVECRFGIEGKAGVERAYGDTRYSAPQLLS